VTRHVPAQQDANCGYASVVPVNQIERNGRLASCIGLTRDDVWSRRAGLPSGKRNTLDHRRQHRNCDTPSATMSYGLLIDVVAITNSRVCYPSKDMPFGQTRSGTQSLHLSSNSYFSIRVQDGAEVDMWCLGFGSINHVLSHFASRFDHMQMPSFVGYQ
jgi:hypothetical protein